MPAPETADWLELYGGWDGFVEAVHESIGGRRGSGVLKFAKSGDGGGDSRVDRSQDTGGGRGRGGMKFEG